MTTSCRFRSSGLFAKRGGGYYVVAGAFGFFVGFCHLVGDLEAGFGEEFFEFRGGF